jgi:hypothetical protein
VAILNIKLKTTIVTARLQDNQLKGMFFLILFTVLSVLSALTDAQPDALKSKNIYNGSPTGIYENSTSTGNPQDFHAPLPRIRGHR